MALTKAQEEYLKGLGIGKGAGRGGALSGAGGGAAKGAAIGSIVPGLGTGAGAVVGGLIGGIGGWLKGRGKAKKAQAEARAKMEQANATFNRVEDKRLSRLGAGQALLQGLAGKGFSNIDPETLAKLSARREMDPAEMGLYNQFAGAGSEAAGGLVDTAMDYGLQYAANRQGGAPMSPGQAGVPMQETVGVNTRLGGSTSNPGFQPFAPLQLNDFQPYNDDSPDF